MHEVSFHSVETRRSWIVAAAAFCIIALSFGAPWIAVVSLKSIAAETGGERSVAALAGSLAWLGVAVGGLPMGWAAEKTGARWTVVFGSLMIGSGLALSTLGATWQLLAGHGLFIGAIGLAGINAPLYVYVSRWFDRRRGSALALISGGSYFAGTVWPPVFERAVAMVGWRQTMLWYGMVDIALVVPLALIFLRPAPEVVVPVRSTSTGARRQVLGLPPNLVFALIVAASFLCCIPMAMPQGHLVAFCSDLGISASTGAVMLSVLLGSAFLSRQFWGLISDRFGGLRTVLIGSGCQALAMTGFLVTQDEVGLFTLAAAFGFGFGGLVPAYVLAIRELFPGSEASWRIPSLLLGSGLGMAAGGWMAGFLYDHFGYYMPAFAAGIAFNLLNFVLVGTMVYRIRSTRAAPA
jgi:MFS family permease